MRSFSIKNFFGASPFRPAVFLTTGLVIASLTVFAQDPQAGPQPPPPPAEPEQAEPAPVPQQPPQGWPRVGDPANQGPNTGAPYGGYQTNGGYPPYPQSGGYGYPQAGGYGYPQGPGGPQGQMPPYSAARVSDAELADLYAFLKFKPSNQADESRAGTVSAGNPQNGKALYMSYGCYNCHGRYAEGSVATGPRLNPAPVSLDDLIKYVRHPSGDMPPYTVKVAPDSELADIFAFLKSLPAPPKVDSIPLLK